MGCTHYPPFLRPPLIDKVAGGNVRIVDPAPFIARKAEGIWPPQFAGLGAYQGSEFWVSARPRDFQRTARGLLREEIPQVKLYGKSEEGT